jgi:hypothetical protein
MILRKRRKGKAAQALDALAGITKIWSELQIGKKAGQGVAKVKKVRLPWLKSKPAKAIGAVAVAGGVGAVVAKKMKGETAPVYTGPAPSEAVEAAAKAPDAPPPLAVAPDPDPSPGIPAAGSAALRDSGSGDDEAAGTSDEPAAGSEALRDDDPAAEEPAAAAEEPAAAEADEPTADEAPAAVQDEPVAAIEEPPAEPAKAGDDD